MKILGFCLVIVGILVVVGYMFYYFITTSDLPLPIRVAVPAVVVGFLILLASVGIDRYRATHKENFKEIGR